MCTGCSCGVGSFYKCCCQKAPQALLLPLLQPLQKEEKNQRAHKKVKSGTKTSKDNLISSCCSYINENSITEIAKCNIVTDFQVTKAIGITD